MKSGQRAGETIDQLECTFGEPLPADLRERFIAWIEGRQAYAAEVDPTPASDGANAVISVLRGDVHGAATSVASIIPVFGDPAKLNKLKDYPAKLARILKVSERSETLRRLLRPVLEQLHNLLQRAPLDQLPAALREPVERLKKQLDEVGKRGDGAWESPVTSTAPKAPAQQPNPVQQQQAKPPGWAKQKYGYWTSNRRVFPTE